MLRGGAPTPADRGSYSDGHESPPRRPMYTPWRMGIRDWFAKDSQGLRRIKAPSPEYPTARAAIEAMLRAHPDVGQDEDWITFEAQGAGKKATVEVADHQVNFCMAD